MSKVHKYEPLTIETFEELLDILNNPTNPPLYNPFRTQSAIDAWGEACKEYAESMGVKTEEDEIH